MSHFGAPPPPPPPPLSPLSMSSNDSSLVGRYGALGGPGGGTPPSEVAYTGGPYGAARPPQTSPPSSQHPSSSTDMSRPSASGSSVNGNRPPSSASSAAMSNDGRPGFGKPAGDRESVRSRIRPEGEEALSRHYYALKAYLAAQLQDEKGNIKPNRARDKLLRLSVTQFMELSTDVYDELIRREDERTQRIDNVPRFLLPKQNFHPKRNQARQKLSTLPTERFRQLATDVFFELERRIPRFAGGDMGRPRSSGSNASSRSRATSRAGMRPPPSPGYGFPPGAGRGRGYPPGPPGPPGSPYGPGPGGLRRPSEAGSLGRPLPKHFQSNTIVPNKSTMVEDDEADDDEDAFGLDHVGAGLGEHDTDDKEKIAAQESEITELKEKLAEFELRLAEKDQDGGSSEWAAMREELEEKSLEAQKLNESLEQELAAYKAKSQEDDEIRTEHDRNLQHLRDELASHQEENDELRAQLAAEGGRDQQRGSRDSTAYEQQIRELNDQLARQQEISNEVREEATMYLGEMRDLSRQNDQAIEKEEQMAARISQLEKDNNEWRQRYAKIKAQNKQLRASTMGLGLQSGFDSGSLVRQEGLISEGGLVRDTDVTRFQVAVDELLKVARQTSTESMLESVKDVVVSVQSITAAVRTNGYPSPDPSPQGPDGRVQQQAPNVNKLKARVTGTANSLITATKQHAASHGLSPVALLDAAASNLTAAVVELIKAVHIKPSSKAEFQDLENADDVSALYGGALSVPAAGSSHSLQIPVPTIREPSSSDGGTMTADPPTRKANGGGGWFGWAGKWNDNHQDGAQQEHSQHHGAAVNGVIADDSDGEYDPYR